MHGADVGEVRTRQDQALVCLSSLLRLGRFFLETGGAKEGSPMAFDCRCREGIGFRDVIGCCNMVREM